METIPKYDNMIERLQKGEEVKCKECQKGIYRPFNPKYKINHAYVCDNCGSVAPEAVVNKAKTWLADHGMSCRIASHA